MTAGPAGNPKRDNPAKLGVRDLQAYWETLHEESRRGTLPLLQVVCTPGVHERVNRLAHREHARLLGRLWSQVADLHGQRVLDVGCGVGRWLEALRAAGAEMVGVDWSLAALTGVRERLGVPVLRMSASALGFADQTFDGINCVTVLQHNPPEDQELALREIFRVLKPGGWFCLLESTVVATLAPHMFAHSQQEWLAMARATGFEVERVTSTCYGALLSAYVQLRHWIGQRLLDTAATPPPATAPPRPSGLVRLNAVILLTLAVVCYALSRLLHWVPGLSPMACAILLRRPR